MEYYQEVDQQPTPICQSVVTLKLNNRHRQQGIKKRFPVFCAHFWHLKKSSILRHAKEIERNFCKSQSMMISAWTEGRNTGLNRSTM